jgi:hypothetical protein
MSKVRMVTRFKVKATELQSAICKMVHTCGACRLLLPLGQRPNSFCARSNGRGAVKSTQWAMRKTQRSMLVPTF